MPVIGGVPPLHIFTIATKENPSRPIIRSAEAHKIKLDIIGIEGDIQEPWKKTHLNASLSISM